MTVSQEDRSVLKSGVTTSDAVARLADLENQIEKGILLQLPCPIGTIVYTIHKGKQCKGFGVSTMPCKRKVNPGFMYYSQCSDLGCNPCSFFETIGYCHDVSEEKFSLNMLHSFGKTIFLTKKEAYEMLWKKNTR